MTEEWEKRGEFLDQLMKKYYPKERKRILKENAQKEVRESPPERDKRVRKSNGKTKGRHPAKQD